MSSTKRYFAFISSLFLLLFLFSFLFPACSSDSSSTAADTDSTAGVTDSTGGDTVPLASIALSIDSANLVIGAAAQFTATGTYSDATTADITADVTYTASNSNATVDAAGLLTAAAEGSVEVTASLDGIDSAAVTVTVTAATGTAVELSSIDLAIDSSSVANGLSAQFTATGTYSDATTADITADVTYTASNSNATVDAAGLLTAAAEGSVEVTASLNSIDSSAVTVTITAAELVSIALSIDSASVVNGLSAQFTATGTYSDAGVSGITADVIYLLSNSNATVSAAGELTGTAEGTVDVTASLDSIDSSAVTVTITAAELLSIALSINSNVLPRGLSAQFVATGAYTDAGTVGITSDVTYSASNNNAMVDAAGALTAAAVGTVDVTASLAGINSNTITVTVTGAVFTQIDVASPGSMGVKSDGTLWGWGDDFYGNLGAVACTPSSDCPVLQVPTQVGTDTDWAAVSMGYYHTAAIKTDGTLWAWGKNSNGQLGVGSLVASAVPLQVGGDTDWASVDIGERQSLAIKIDGTLWSWGLNGSGELGNGCIIGTDCTDSNVPVQVGTDTDWSVSRSDYQSLALKNDGTLWSWGGNDSGQLGDNSLVDNSTPTQVGVETYQSIGAGQGHSLAVTTGGALYAWGSNYIGQLGLVSCTPEVDCTAAVTAIVPTQAGADTDWESVSAGISHSAAIRTDGTIWTWGSNQSGPGQLGDGTNIPHSLPVQVGTATNWSSVSAGEYHTMALKRDDTLWGWGDNNSFYLGKSYTIPKNTVDPATLVFDRIDTGEGHTLGLAAGKLYSWGPNSFGQLGTNDCTIGLNCTTRETPTQVGADTDWADIGAGADFSVAIKTDGTLWSWGNNNTNQLGDGGITPSDVATKVGADTDWAAVQTGRYHTLAMKTDGTLWAWGYNGFGQGGDGTTTNIIAPQKIGADTDWSRFSAGRYHSLAIKTDGTLWAWGRGNQGQVGEGSTIGVTKAPIKIGTDTDWYSVSGGGSFSMALKANGTLWSWGRNSNGEQGDGCIVGTDCAIVVVPTQVGTDTDWGILGAGVSHALAIKADGSLWAWGKNLYGQLGDGCILVDSYFATDCLDSSTPTRVGSDNNWGSVSGGSLYSLGLKTGGSLWGWGEYASGRLATGDLSPAQVFP